MSLRGARRTRPAKPDPKGVLAQQLRRLFVAYGQSVTGGEGRGLSPRMWVYLEEMHDLSHPDDLKVEAIRRALQAHTGSYLPSIGSLCERVMALARERRGRV